MGTKGSGKDTCGDYLIDQYGFSKKSFADPLKRACQELFLFSHEQVFGTQEQKETPDMRWFNCTPRTALQYVGTELLRDQLNEIMPGLGKNIFTYRFQIWYQEEVRKNPDLRVVITDVRFKNEIDFIQSLGGTVIKLERNPIINIPNDLEEEFNPNIDSVVNTSDNNSSDSISTYTESKPIKITEELYPNLRSLVNEKTKEKIIQGTDTHSSEIELQSITSYDHLIENNGTKEELYQKMDMFMAKMNCNAICKKNNNTWFSFLSKLLKSMF